MLSAPQAYLPPAYQRRLLRMRSSRRSLGLGRFGLVPMVNGGVWPISRGPIIAPYGPFTYGGGTCTPPDVAPPAGMTWNQATCSWQGTPIIPTVPATPQTPPAIASTPVPANFPTNQIFVNTDGSQWIYSVSQGTWISMGVPYNVNAPGATPTAATAVPNVAGTPVPANFPTNQIYVNTDGSQWIYNPQTNAWQMSSPATALPATSLQPIVVSAPAAAVPAESDYQSIIDFATQSSLIPGIANWIVAVGVVLAYKLVSSKGR